METIKNRVAESGLVVFDLEDYRDGRPVREFDLAPFLYEGLMLREKEYRSALAEVDWSEYEGAHVGIFCSTDAIIPMWAYILAASKLYGIAYDVTGGDAGAVRDAHYKMVLDAIDWDEFADRMVVIKGCAGDEVPTSAYIHAVGCLQRVARKVMFGEPCSTVPIWRRPSRN